MNYTFMETKSKKYRYRYSVSASTQIKILVLVSVCKKVVSCIPTSRPIICKACLHSTNHVQGWPPFDQSHARLASIRPITCKAGLHSTNHMQGWPLIPWAPCTMKNNLGRADMSPQQPPHRARHHTTAS